MKLLLPIVLSGVLAAASPGCLERVQARRIANGWGLTEPARPGVVLIAVRDCSLLGHDGLLIVEWQGRRQARPARVVDCQQAEHTPLAELGLAADVSEAELNHARAVVLIWDE